MKLKSVHLCWGLAVIGLIPGLMFSPQKTVATAKAPVKDERIVSFNREVRPILSEHCYKCHGPDAKQAAGDLRLDIGSEATKDQGGYHVIKPGNPDDSLLLARVVHPNSKKRMPPSDSGMSALTPGQIETLRLWIKQGARYERHWAFMTPVKPAPPKLSSPWIKNDIDRFVLAQLQKNGLTPEPEADRQTLIRRVALALTGLPPTPAQIDKFLTDQSPTAYEQMVDRFLADPAYGENQARYWLDAVRYGDTHGLHLDNERAIHPYRDWVVRSINQDLPYDKFTIHQIAGDLLPNPTQEQLIATGYVRMNPTTSEGGAIEEEFLAKNTFDRVDTTSTVFLGLTVACSRCHDHKYDPISQKEYYQMYAYFNSTVDAPFDGNLLTPGPVMPAPSPEMTDLLAKQKADLDQMTAKVEQAAAMTFLNGLAAERPEATGFEYQGPFAEKTFAEAYAKAYPPEKNEGEWKPINLKLGGQIDDVIKKDNAAGYFRTTITLKAATDLQFQLSSDDGAKVWVNGKLVHEVNAQRGVATAVDRFKAAMKAGPNVVIIKVINGGGQDGLKIQAGSLEADRAAEVLLGKKLEEIKATALEFDTTQPSHKEFREKITRHRALQASIPMTLIAKEMPKPRPAYILRRGEYNLPTTIVNRSVPAAINVPKAAPKDRLGFAKWLVDPRHPLTSRVFVNRIWQQHFGTGIVKTSEDFGNQGEWPSHPELLDYLAVRFMEDGWSLKRFTKLILTSAAFRQRAVVTPAKLEKDPENRLISRGPRFRLDAEVIRDQALAVSGLLEREGGGKGFKPYQPSGIWEALAFSDSNTSRYTMDAAPAIYRRSLYLFWKRTSPPPVMLTFDAPMRESCSVRRFRTNTPLQALTTLNEPAFVEASRVFAERLLKDASTDTARLHLAFRTALGRRPKAQELTLLTQSLQRYRQTFAKDEAGAVKLISVGLAPRDKTLNAKDHAAWTLVASTLMNLDEFLTLQ